MLLDEILASMGAMPEESLRRMEAIAVEERSKRKWIPSPGKQTDAYFSKADILLYGGAAGGGKSNLLLGLALTQHRRSLVMRRQYSDLGGLTEEIIRMNGTRDGFNGSAPPKLRTPDNRLIEFGACLKAGSEESWQGQPHDLIGFDEAAQFLEQQVRFIITWNRTSDIDQPCRAILASNPPINSDGDWIIGMFRPWLDPTHHNPAKDGELRYFITDAKGIDCEVDSALPIERDGKEYKPKSRTFIRSSVDDNPYLVRTNYKATLDAMPEPYRSAMRDGNFMLARTDNPLQVIPTAWVRAAMGRWTEKRPNEAPMCCIAADIAQGGPDKTIISTRYDSWFSPLVEVEGALTPTGAEVAGLVITHRRDDSAIVLDMGGGYGGAAMEHLKVNGLEVKGYLGGGKSFARTRDKKLTFYNKRAESWWKLREALDPSQEGGSQIQLPDDPVLLADLTAVNITGEITSRGIQIEKKEDVKKRLGRSPDKGDAVVMAWSEGNKIHNFVDGWKGHKTPTPQVIHGHSNRKRKR